MQHFLVILLGLHLVIGLLLLRVGPLSALMQETRGDALGSRLLLAVFILMLWPCLWPTAIYRPQFSLSQLTFDVDSRMMGQFDTDRLLVSSDTRAGAGNG